MGGKSLMGNRKIVLFLIVSLSLCASSLSREKITEMVTKIKVERAGIDIETLENTPNPFPIIKPSEVGVQVADEPQKIVTKVKASHNLTAILNHRAFIDGKWYKLGDNLGSYRVESISRNSVTLRSANESKKLIIAPRKKKFKMFKGE
jgi:hypothetical protein